MRRYGTVRTVRALGLGAQPARAVLKCSGPRTYPFLSEACVPGRHRASSSVLACREHMTGQRDVRPPTQVVRPSR